MKKSYLSLIGFALFFFGFMSLILSLVQLKIGFLAFIDAPGRTFGLVVKLLMVFGGMIILYLSKMDRTV